MLAKREKLELYDSGYFASRQRIAGLFSSCPDGMKNMP